MARKLTAAQKKAILDLVPKNLPAADRSRLAAAINKSTNGLDDGDGSKVAEGITEFRAMMQCFERQMALLW